MKDFTKSLIISGGILIISGGLGFGLFPIIGGLGLIGFGLFRRHKENKISKETKKID